MSKQTILKVLPAIILSNLLTVAIIYAWAEPTQAPPRGNVPAPINVGGTTQFKAGALGIGGVFQAHGGTPNPVLTVVGGNVGIGTTAPLDKLEVRDGNVFVVGTNRGLRIQNNVGNSFWFNTPSDNLLSIGGVGGIPPRSGAINITSNGNVGIGTTAPATPLHVVGTTKSVGGVQILPLSTPQAPTVTPHGVTGTTTWGYRITARSAVGETLASVEGRTTTGNATLSTTNFNRITWSPVPGAVDYRIYRTTAPAPRRDGRHWFRHIPPSPPTGLIGTTTLTTFDDTGLAASGAVPTFDSSGNLSVRGNAHENCEWTGWVEAGRGTGYWEQFCPPGKFAAGMGYQKHRESWGDFDWYSFRIYCCDL